MSSFFLLQHYGCFCRSSSSLLLLLESAGHLCSHKVPIIQMMSIICLWQTNWMQSSSSHAIVQNPCLSDLEKCAWKLLNECPQSSRAQTDIVLSESERAPAETNGTSAVIVPGIESISGFFLYANAGSYRDNWGCEFNVCTNKNWWAVTEESHGDFKCH